MVYHLFHLILKNLTREAQIALVLLCKSRADFQLLEILNRDERPFDTGAACTNIRVLFQPFSLHTSERNQVRRSA